MFFEIAILAASGIAGLAAITVSSINYVKYLDKIKDKYLDKEEKDKESDKKVNDIKVFESASYELDVCPFCNVKRTGGVTALGIDCKIYYEKNNEYALKNLIWGAKGEKAFYACSPVCVCVDGENINWQCCLRCLGQWHVRHVEDMKDIIVTEESDMKIGSTIVKQTKVSKKPRPKKVKVSSK